MSQHLCNSMRFLYKKDGTSYEDLLEASQEAKGEWMENKSTRVKNVSVIENDGLKALKEQISSLASAVTASQSLTKGRGPKANSAQKGKKDQEGKPKTRGPETGASRPFCKGQRLIQCFKCGGVGAHCPNLSLTGKPGLEESKWGRPSSGPNRPCNTKEAIKDHNREGDHRYHNPDPLYQLIGLANELNH